MSFTQQLILTKWQEAIFQDQLNKKILEKNMIRDKSVGEDMEIFLRLLA